VGIAGYIAFGLCLSLSLTLLWRGHQTGEWRAYAFFFGYVAYTLLYSIVLLVLLLTGFRAYARLFWVCYTIEILLQFGVAWEVFRQTFPRGASLRPIAASALVSALCLLALVFYLSGPQPGLFLEADFSRKVALSVVVSLFVVLGLARYYGIPVGRNVHGMAIGLLLLASSHIANFAAVEIFPAFTPIWSLLGPFGFALTLLIWAFALWSYAPNPRPVAPDRSRQGEALSRWEQRWAALGTTIRKVLK
jgi:hypothetical protein